LSFPGLWIGIQKDVARRGASRRLYLQDAGPAGWIAGAHQFGEAIAVAGSSGEDEFAGGSEFEEGAVGEVRAGAVDSEW